jgi:hypothetical protein
MICVDYLSVSLSIRISKTLTTILKMVLLYILFIHKYKTRIFSFYSLSENGESLCNHAQI